MDIILASSNAHKGTEFRRLFARHTEFQLLLPTDVGLQPLDVPEPGHTFAENALAKAHAYLQAYRIPVLADDSGLCVDALAGAPGVRSARFGAPELDDAGRTRYLLACLANIPPSRRGAHYVCCLALARPDQATMLVTGYCYGRIAEEVVPGPTGFGYDPVFLLPSLGRTVSQLTPEQKDAVSHRGKAVRALLEAVGA